MKISIVTISFNQAKFLRQCIDSVLNQDYPNIEYIIVDPGSTDGSREIIDSYGDQLIRVYEKDTGPSDGLNKGFARATGDIFYFINSDDYVLPDAFAKVIRIFQNNLKVDVVLAAGLRVNEVGESDGVFFPSKVSVLSLVNGAVTLFQQGMFFKHDLFRQVGGFNIENRSCWDGELLLAFLIKDATITRTMEKVATFRIYPESITGSQRLSARFKADHQRMFETVYGKNKSPNRLVEIFFRSKKLLADPVYLYYRIFCSGILKSNASFSWLGQIVPHSKRATYPILRLLRNKAKFYSAKFTARYGTDKKGGNKSVIFIIGCGRSGTTIMGDVLSHNPAVSYLFEPWWKWAALDHRLDLIKLLTKGEAKAIVRGDFVTDQIQSRFDRIFTNSIPVGNYLIEKTPHNAFRIDFLSHLVQGAYFINMVRDGLDISASINEIATTNIYKIYGMPKFNQWWGDCDSKWLAILHDALAEGYKLEELKGLVTHRQKGALEWILSLREVDRHREKLGVRLIDVKYEKFVNEPRTELDRVVSIIGMNNSNEWITQALTLVRNPAKLRKITQSPILELPQKICDEFNNYQIKYGYVGRAVVTLPCKNVFLN